ncbi:unnamed protein product [Echinostoma caproni]|uniref:Rabaptin domain-containing protein n=1 Tax=Echinostoma caproni TaxID=27848 RepID=A0A183BCN5_9TREM|nr:unnamed protein product [Echinostoma caproni]
MLESGEMNLGETGSTTNVQAGKRSTTDLWHDGDHQQDVRLPEYVNQILSRITDPSVVEELKNVIQKNMHELSQHQADRDRARSEAEEIRDKLQRTETELGDLRSAAALMVAGQDDALVTLKRQYDEELASWRSISEQQILELSAANRRLLEHERATWAGERDALLSQITSAPRKMSLEENTTGVTGGAPAGTGSAARFFSVSDKLSGQNLANQALESMERMARRVRQKVMANNLWPEDESSEAAAVPAFDIHDPVAVQRKLEMHEREVLRLRNLLKETPEKIAPLSTG